MEMPMGLDCPDFQCYLLCAALFFVLERWDL